MSNQRLELSPYLKYGTTGFERNNYLLSFHLHCILEMILDLLARK